MKKVIATLYEVHCGFDWMNDGDGDKWTCATLDGARRFVEKQKEKGLTWYAIEGRQYLPCNDEDPDGQLYIGIIYHEFREVRK